MRGIFYRCCGREVFINVCTTGGTTPCQEFSYQINCGCSYIGSASATCLSSAAAEDKSGRVDTLLAEVTDIQASKGLSMQPLDYSRPVCIQKAWIISNYVARGSAFLWSS